MNDRIGVCDQGQRTSQRTKRVCKKTGEFSEVFMVVVFGWLGLTFRSEYEEGVNIIVYVNRTSLDEQGWEVIRAGEDCFPFHISNSTCRHDQLDGKPATFGCHRRHKFRCYFFTFPYPQIVGQ